MSSRKLKIDPGFVHHSKIHTILQSIGTDFINEQINKISSNTPEWQKPVVIDHIYTRVMVDFCNINGIKTLEQVLLEESGRLFCSIVKTEPCEELYEQERVHIKCNTFEGSLEVELQLPTRRITGDTLRS